MVRLASLALLAGLAVLEVAAVLALVDLLGPGPALAALALDVLAGLLVLRWGLRSTPPQRGWRLAAGAFIALPGFVLDVVGCLLLVPAVQRIVAQRVSRGAESVLRRGGISVVTVTEPGGGQRTTVRPGDVIAGQVVEEPEQADRAPGRGPGPQVIRGEISEG